MSEPIDCRCPHCHCPTGTRNPDGICRSCGSGNCPGEPRAGAPVHEAEWVHRAHDHHLPPKVVVR